MPTSEDQAWDWLDSKFLNVEAGHDPADRDYNADEMVDAFMAGRASLSSQLAQAQEALRAVQSWWLEEGMHQYDGAPYCMFAVRAALQPTPNAGEGKVPAHLSRECSDCGARVNQPCHSMCGEPDRSPSNG